MNTNPSGPDASAADQIQPSRVCPSCGDEALELIADVELPICPECGLAVGTDLETPKLPEQRDTTNESQNTSWDEYYSVSNSTEKQIATAFEILDDLGRTLDLSTEILLIVADIYAEAALENLTDGRPTSLVVAAAVCIGTREADAPRPSVRVASAVGHEPSNVKQTIRIFQQKLNLGYTDLSAGSYVPYLCRENSLPEPVERRALELIEYYESKHYGTGTNPAGTAGAAIYLAADGEVTQRRIAGISGVSKETIRTRLNELREVSLG